MFAQTDDFFDDVGDAVLDAGLTTAEGAAASMFAQTDAERIHGHNRR